VNVDLTSLDGPGHFRTIRRELDFAQTRDDTTLRTNEMRVPRGVMLICDGLEPPHVVADVGPSQQTYLCEVGQVSVDRREIPYHAEDRNPRGCRPQSRPTNRIAKLLEIARPRHGFESSAPQLVMLLQCVCSFIIASALASLTVAMGSGARRMTGRRR